MNPDLLERAENIWNRHKKTIRFQARFNLYPSTEGKTLVEDFRRLGESIPDQNKPNTLEEVYQLELRRRALGEALWLEHRLSGRPLGFDDINGIFGIEPEDIKNLRPWLERHRIPTLGAIERVYQETEIADHPLELALDLPEVRAQAENLALTTVRGYHRKLGKLYEGLTQVGGILREIDAIPTTNERSYFNPDTMTLAIGIPAICYMTSDRTPQIKQRSLIGLMGHEGFGHGVNAYLTKTGDIPFFLKQSSGATIACLESVAQFYEKQIFDDLENSPAIQQELDIAHRFPEILKEERDIKQIDTFGSRTGQYAITVLADKSLGDPMDPDVLRKKIDLISEVALYPGYARGFVNRYRQSYDLERNLDVDLMAEIRYAAQPATKAIRVLADRGIAYPNQRSEVDRMLLQGYWTPVGLVQRASVA